MKDRNEMMRLLLLSFVLIHAHASAELDQYEQKGLQDTQQMLKSPHLRKEAIKGSKEAQAVDQKVEALAGSGRNKEEIYDIASQVMETIAVESKGDPDKMQKLLMEAQANPQAFYNKYFTAEQKAKVRNLANDIEKTKGKASAPR